MELPKPIKEFIEFISQFPGIGSRQATRLAFWLLHQEKEKKKKFLTISQHLLINTQICPNCFFVSERKKEKSQTKSLCEICSDRRRNSSLICVVEKETDLLTIEKTNKYKGLYHILGGLISKIDENKKQALTINQLILRIKKSSHSSQPVKELILALNPTSEGNLTSYLLEKEINKLNLNIKITKLGRGLPQGSEVEFSDSETLINALLGRK